MPGQGSVKLKTHNLTEAEFSRGKLKIPSASLEEQAVNEQNIHFIDVMLYWAQ